MSQLQTSIQCSNLAQKKSGIMSSELIQHSLDDTVQKMTQAERSGEYIKAQSFKKSIQRLKKDLVQCKLKQVAVKHKKEKKQLQKNHFKQISNCQTFWQLKNTQLSNEGIATKQQAKEKHKIQVVKLQQQMEIELAKTFKQSSECLNFRKIQENMAKQKKYVQAHKTHKRIQQLEVKQKQMFAKQKKNKIELAKQSLLQRQNNYNLAIEKKIQTALIQIKNDLNNQLSRLKNKHNNNVKQLVSLQQKEVLELKGQFKSKVGLASSSSKSRLFAIHK